MAESRAWDWEQTTDSLSLIHICKNLAYIGQHHDMPSEIEIAAILKKMGKTCLLYTSRCV